MSSEIDSSKLLDRASELVALAKRAGADEADAVIVRSRSQSVGVRLGKVESTESSESDDFSLRVFVGKRVASVSANPGFDLKTLAERAVAMAKVSPEDPLPALPRRSVLRRLTMTCSFSIRRRSPQISFGMRRWLRKRQHLR